MTAAEFQDQVSARAALAEIAIAPALMQSLWMYFDVLSTWNKTINLTSLDLSALPADAIDRLLIEPIAAAQLVPSGGHVIDIGTGGGSPAIPFALTSGASHLTMVESRARKSVFLREAARTVGLSATVLTQRFEELATSDTMLGVADVVTVRAVTTDAESVAQLVNMLRPDGRLLLFKQKGSLAEAAPAGCGSAITEVTKSAMVQVIERLK